MDKELESYQKRLKERQEKLDLIFDLIEISADALKDLKKRIENKDKNTK